MILNEITKTKQKRVEQAKREKSYAELKEEAKKITGKGFLANNILDEIGKSDNAGGKMMVIAEVKLASPSKGKFDFKLDLPELVQEYEKGGADIISVVTEEDHFMGSKELFGEVLNLTHLPLLRKDFIIDPYQIYESKIMGASFLLLICAILDEDDLKEYINLTVELGMTPLIEVHTREELDKALRAGARLIGINNRNLREFKTSLENTAEILPHIPPDKVVISESGIKERKDIDYLKSLSPGDDDDDGDGKSAVVAGVLIGESMVTSHDPASKIKELKQGHYSENS